MSRALLGGASGDVRMRFASADEPWDDARHLAIAHDADLEAVAPQLAGRSVVALDFEKWTDGRAYSIAHVLRSRYGFGGEIRATGEVLADMLPLLARCGFDAVVLRGDQSVDTAKRALGFFPDGHYQGDVLEPRPHFAREATT